MIECICLFCQVFVGFINTHPHYLSRPLNQSALDQLFPTNLRQSIAISTNLSVTQAFTTYQICANVPSGSSAVPFKSMHEFYSILHNTVLTIQACGDSLKGSRTFMTTRKGLHRSV